MPTSQTPELGYFIGLNVARRRTDWGWSQTDMVHELSRTGSNWSSASVSLLENRGSRGERLSDLADLCKVLQIGLWDLLDGQPRTKVATKAGVVRELAWITEALRGPDSSKPARPTTTHW